MIALSTPAERQAMFVRHADEVVTLETDARIGYLDHEALERALVAARADAVWVGWGFVAEDPRFVELCERLGIVFVGPELRGDAEASATRSRPSGSPRPPASRSRPGAAGRSTRPRTPRATPRRSATR